jgi:small subunit ribosomal protein S16
LAVKLRLRRIGKKKQPMYKVVAADSRAPRDGKFLESLGLYNPLTNPHTLEIKEDRVLYWLGVGAQPTDTVMSLLRQKGITLKRELKKKGLSDEKINERVSQNVKRVLPFLRINQLKKLKKVQQK